MLTTAQIMPALGDWNIFGNLFGSKPGELETVPDLWLGYVPTVHSIDPVVLDKLYAPNFVNMKFKLIKFDSWDDLLKALRTGTIQGASLPAALVLAALRMARLCKLWPRATDTEMPSSLPMTSNPLGNSGAKRCGAGIGFNTNHSSLSCFG